MEKVRERLERAAQTLNQAGIPYAVANGNAVAAWVSRVDEAAVRNTRNVDILLRRADLPKAIEAMERAGFVYRHAAGFEMFLDGPEASARDTVHVVFAGEKVRAEYVEPAPDVAESEVSKGVNILKLEALVTMKLTSFRDKDRTHLRDMLEIGLLNSPWTTKVPIELGDRLQQLLDDPHG